MSRFPTQRGVTFQQLLDGRARRLEALRLANAHCMRRVAAACLPHSEITAQEAPDSKEGQAAVNDLALTTTTAMDGRTWLQVPR
jgi:hypothetical protein